MGHGTHSPVSGSQDVQGHLLPSGALLSLFSVHSLSPGPQS